jgi:hypothetical protein
MTTSFESRIAELLSEQATLEQPPARVSVGAAIRRGNSRLRRRRAGLAGVAPAALVASAVVAIALIGTVPLGSHQAGGKSGAGRQPAATAPPLSPAAGTGSLPLLHTDARFGWLPPGEQLRSGFQSSVMAYMNVEVGRIFSWELRIWATGACVLGSRAGEELRCEFGWSYPVGGRAPSIHGHEAFWVGHRAQQQEIIWEYAPGAWAVFRSPSCCSAAANRQPVATLLQIARGVSFGPASGERLSFDFQLTDVPSDWRVSSVSYEASGGLLLADGAEVTGRQDPRTQMSITIMHGGTGNADPCWRSAAGPTKHTKLRGYDVETTTDPPSVPGWRSDTYQLCAPDVRGSSFLITAPDHPVVTPSELFDHMRFLGPSSADWVTNPIG